MSLQEESRLRHSELYLSSEYEAPVGRKAQPIAEVWQCVLNIDRIGVQDDFFEVSGDYCGAAVTAMEMCCLATVPGAADFRRGGKGLILRSRNRCENMDVLNTCLPKAEVRIVSYLHHRLFTNVLFDMQTFLNDVITADLRETFIP